MTSDDGNNEEKRPQRELFLLVVVALALSVPTVLAAPRLPEPLAVHWGLNGGPNGFSSKWIYLLGTTVPWILTWWLAFGRTRDRSGPPRRTPYLVAGLLLAVHGSVLVANFDVKSSSTADLNPIVALVVPALGLLAGAVLSRWLEPRARVAAIGVAGVPSIQVGASERVMWFGRARNRWTYVIAFVPFGYVVLSAAGGQTPFAMLIVVAVAALVFAEASVTVTAERVLVSLGPLRWPRIAVPLSTIGYATATNLEPMAVGGWGFRMGRGGRAVVVRRGDSLVLGLGDGAKFVVTVDGAEEAAELINGLLRR